MEWTSTDTLALACNSCASCLGTGLTTGKRGKAVPCNCSLRAVFRACYARFRYCVAKEKYMSRVTLTHASGRERRLTWGRVDEEYIADFYLVSKRTLSEFEFKVFKYHFLFGADWRLCCRQLRIDRGTFFHAVYRIQQRLGRVFRELQPYPLYPLDEYFNGTFRRETYTPPKPPAVKAKRIPFPRPVSPPLLLAA